MLISEIDAIFAPALKSIEAMNNRASAVLADIAQLVDEEFAATEVRANAQTDAQQQLTVVVACQSCLRDWRQNELQDVTKLEFSTSRPHFSR